MNADALLERTLKDNGREACRIVVMLTPENTVHVQAPMRHKDLCYQILADARTIVARTPINVFFANVRHLSIVMWMDGTVDVAAPLPVSRELCYQLIRDAKIIVEKYEADYLSVPLGG